MYLLLTCQFVRRYYCGAVPVPDCVARLEAALAVAQQQSAPIDDADHASARCKGVHPKARAAVVARDITPFDDLRGYLQKKSACD